MANQLIYGKQPVAEAERGKRSVHRIWRAPETPAEELEHLCGSPDHQGVVAEVDPYPYADPAALLRGEAPLIVALDQVQDPRNLGAVCRSAEFAGAAGVVIPDRRAVEVTAVACKASAGAVEHLDIAHVRNLADWLGEAKAANFWIWGADAEADPGTLGCRPNRSHGAGPGRRGQWNPAPSRLCLRRTSRISQARRDRVAERLSRRRRAPLRGSTPAVTNATAVARTSVWG